MTVLRHEEEPLAAKADKLSDALKKIADWINPGRWRSATGKAIYCRKGMQVTDDDRNFWACPAEGRQGAGGTKNWPTTLIGLCCVN